MWARHNDGKFVLRIADTDAKRATEENYQAVLRDMEWLGLNWDEGPDVGGPHAPYVQSARTELYDDALRTLAAELPAVDIVTTSYGASLRDPLFGAVQIPTSMH